MAAYTDSIEIQAPAQVGSDIMFNLAAWPEWTASMREVTPLGGGPLGTGTRVRVRQPRLPVAVWTVESMDGYGFEWSARNAGVTSVALHRLTPTSTGCTLTLSLLQTGVLARVADLFVGDLARRYLRLEAEGLKAAAEAAVAGPGSAARAEPLDLDVRRGDIEAEQQLSHRLGENR